MKPASRTPGLSLAAVLLLAAGLRVQEPAPASGGAAGLARRGAELLAREDPVRAWEAFRALQSHAGDSLQAHLGLSRVHLMLGHPETAAAYADAALAADSDCQEAMALRIRSLIRLRKFAAAVTESERFLAAVPTPGAELLAAHASALFRVQRIEAAAAAYRAVLQRDGDHAEAHLRLGSGLLPPARWEIEYVLVSGVNSLRGGDHDRAQRRFRQALAAAPGHPVAHRLLGESLYLEKAAVSMASSAPAFARLRAVLPEPDVTALPVAEFLIGYEKLVGERRAVADRAIALFGSRLSRLITIGGRHDLLAETDRTTDAAWRANLRGRRTFDGRVWDDVRGIGGLRAATGIESLDEAAQYGFDTLAHEVAHQVHYYALPMRDRIRIRELYRVAKAEGRFLDYYAATNEAEYFGQGVEAFSCLGKRPAAETTHGHTRFELYRVDPKLYQLIEELVDFDPLRKPAAREEVLAAAVEVALRSGRPRDAVVAAQMMEPGRERRQLLQRARRATALQRSY